VPTKTTIPLLNIIVAVDSVGGFGKNGIIPWNIPADMQHFKEMTTNNICIMGRITHENMLQMRKSRITPVGSPPIIPRFDDILPNRKSFVVTSNKHYDAEGAMVVPSIRGAIETLDINDTRSVFVIGGEQMFIEALSWTKFIHMTIIKDKTYGCDKYFPINAINKSFAIVNCTETKELYFVTYQRK